MLTVVYCLICDSLKYTYYKLICIYICTTRNLQRVIEKNLLARPTTVYLV